MLAARRFTGFGEAEIVSTWSGCYDVSPDWNPVLGALPGLDGLSVAFGFSGHGFKLSPVIGAMLAADALGTDVASTLGGCGLVDPSGEEVSLSTYGIERFRQDRLLKGAYHGSGL